MGVGVGGVWVYTYAVRNGPIYIDVYILMRSLYTYGFLAMVHLVIIRHTYVFSDIYVCVYNYIWNVSSDR